jgi:di/tricarboxylate transporter
MPCAGLLGSVVSSTAVAAIFIPVVITISERTSLNAGRLLMPLSFAAPISGMMTLIATPSNLVVSAELHYSRYEPLAFFSFLLIGLPLLLLTGATALLVVPYWFPL